MKYFLIITSLFLIGSHTEPFTSKVDLEVPFEMSINKCEAPMGNLDWLEYIEPNYEHCKSCGCGVFLTGEEKCTYCGIKKSYKK